MRLYDITEAYRALSLLAEDGEDVSAELAKIDGELVTKAEGILHVLRNVEGDADKIDQEIKRLTARKRVAENNAARIREHLRKGMEASGVTRIAGGAFTVTLTDGSDRVEVDDALSLPDEYVRVKREADKAAILAHYRATGEIIPGTRIERGTRLVIR